MKPHHFALKVRDLALCKKFYNDILELKIMSYQYDAQDKVRSIWLDMDGTILMLEKSESLKNASELIPEPIGWHLLALSIAKQDREEWKKKLLQHHIIINLETEYSLFFKDPEGNPLALSHYPDKFF